ncbi:MAG: amidohydrolase family protein [Halanaerobiaceae bacterium]
MKKKTGPEIIDSHIHITPPEIIDDLSAYRERDTYFDKLCSSSVNANVRAENVVQVINNSPLERAVVFGFAFRDQDLCQQVNDYTIKKINQFPDYLIGFAVVNPLVEGAVTELQRCKQAGLCGVGEIYATGQGFDFKEKKHLFSVADFCQQNNWPLVVHLNEPIGHYYEGKTGDSLAEGVALAQNFPEVTFIFAHLGGGLCFYELMPELRASLSNVYYDTAAVPFLYENQIYNTLKEAGVAGKILLGSDYPLIKPQKYITSIKNSSFSPEEKQNVLGGNLRKILSRADRSD